MPSPFPGMDPYLEDRRLWKGVHDSLIYRMLEDLQPRLQPRYLAVLEGRLVLQLQDQAGTRGGFRTGWSEVSVQEDPGINARPSAAVMTAPAAPEAAVPEWIEEPDLHIWHSYLEIRDSEQQTVVTVIEVLSPWNKSPGPGQEEYRAKQRALLLSNTNLVEIDLLRTGSHTVAVPASKLLASDYRVCIHRAARPAGFEVLRFSLRDPLPRVGIPLQPDESDVVLDLPTISIRVYDTGVYSQLVEYAGPVDPPVEASDADWAAELLQTAGYR